MFSLALSLLGLAPITAHATVAVSPLFGSNMVLQRDKPVPVSGTASPDKTITVSYNGQIVTTTSDAQGKWQVTLAAMGVKTAGSNFTVSEAGANTVTFSNVVVGDVWVCSGQSNMAFGLGGCDRPGDVSSANFPGIRHFWVPLANLGEPTKDLSGNWVVCSPSTAAGFSAVAFYFGRKIYQDQAAGVPIGLIASTVGGTCIDPWLAPEGLTDIPVIAPLYSQQILPWGPFSLFNGMIYPLAPYPVKGAIWYQGENRETTSQSADSYFLKEKALAQGWKRLWGVDDFPFYVVQLANWLDPSATVIPEGLGSWSDTRQMQAMVLGLPHAGMASAIDIGEAADIHPKNKLDVGERLALWALKNDYARTTVVPSGPILQNVTVAGTNLICSFDYVGAGLMVGSKTNYLPAAEVVGGTLQRFSIAGASGSWYAGQAVISNNTVLVSSPSVANPRKVAYAYWQNPAGANLYNRDGLPASPFYLDDVTAKYTVTASAGPGGNISPAGSTVYLRRMTALYTVTPDPGQFIQDVTVDGLSVGAVKHFTFDPLYANHTIRATFTNAAPNYSIVASAAPGGALSPSGTSTVAQGGAATFTVAPNPGALVSVFADGRPMGARTSFTFADVRTNHTISASFAFTIHASAGFGGSISSGGVSVVNYGGSKTYTFTPMPGYALFKVLVNGVNAGSPTSYTFSNLTTNQTISASFIGNPGSGSVPQQGQLLFSCLVDSLPASGGINTWSSYLPAGQALAKIGSPTVETIDGRKFVRNNHYDGDGFDQGSYGSGSSIACNGASIVVAAKPVRNGVSTPWVSIVDAFYNELALGINNNAGQVCVWRKGYLATSNATIPDGQTTILSLVAQPNGTFKVWANGIQIWSDTTTGGWSSLTAGGAGPFACNVTVGRNWPDQWTTFNGYIGDVFFYKAALTDADRASLEQYVAGRLMSGAGTLCTITATAGAGGTITPSGDVSVNQGASQTFAITPQPGYAVSNLTVNGVSRGALSSYTFTNVTAFHTIHASFMPLPPPPRFDKVSLRGSELVLFSVGATNRRSWLWTSTNLELPPANWTILGTNNVGSDGLFTNTLSLNPAEPRRFYLLSIP